MLKQVLTLSTLALMSVSMTGCSDSSIDVAKKGTPRHQSQR